jgi:hypothetical protein
MSDVTRILSQIESGDPAAAEQLLPLVYDELRKLAAADGRREDRRSEVRGQNTNEYTNIPTSELRSLTSGPSFHSRGHFFAAAAEAMRRILVESG